MYIALSTKFSTYIYMKVQVYSTLHIVTEEERKEENLDLTNYTRKIQCMYIHAIICTV